MIQSFLKSSIRRFGKRYDYDTSFMTYVVDASAGAGLRLPALQFFAGFTGPASAGPIWAGAMLASTLDGDCGPCVQLVFDMAVEAGAPAAKLILCLEGRAAEAGEVGRGFRFAQAAISGDPAADEMRDEIEAEHGRNAVVAVSIASASGRIYPVLKRGLGFGKSCSNVVHGGETIRMVRAS